MAYNLRWGNIISYSYLPWAFCPLLYTKKIRFKPFPAGFKQCCYLSVRFFLGKRWVRFFPVEISRKELKIRWNAETATLGSPRQNGQQTNKPILLFVLKWKLMKRIQDLTQLPRFGFCKNTRDHHKSQLKEIFFWRGGAGKSYEVLTSLTRAVFIPPENKM